MGRSPCCDKDNVKRGPWSPEEDATLKSYVETHGTGGNWIALPKRAGLRRCGKSCRLRWLNYLRPDIKHGGFTEEEDNIICRLYCEIGSRWSVIASNLPGRTDNDVKNYWNTKLKKKILSGKIKLTPNNNNNNFIHLDSKNSSATALLGLNDMPNIHNENHEFSNSNCCILANYAKFPASFTLSEHQMPMEDPVCHRSKFGGGAKCNYDRYGSLLDIISSSSTSSISNSSNSCLSVDNSSAISLSYGNNNGYGEDNTGVDMVDLRFGFEFPMDDVANNDGGFFLERPLSSAYENYSQCCDYPSFADLVRADVKPQEISQKCNQPIN